VARSARPRVPKGLKTAGKGLWRSILADLAPGWELDARELYLLGRACRCADELDSLEKAVDKEGLICEGSRGQVAVHPAVSEARQLRIAQARLLGMVELVDPKAALRAATPAQARGRKAAEARWGLERAKHG
jgi:phage terminase small subunit